MFVSRIGTLGASYVHRAGSIDFRSSVSVTAIESAKLRLFSLFVRLLPKRRLLSNWAPRSYKTTRREKEGARSKVAFTLA